MTFNRTWVILDIHVDGGLDHTAALVRSSVGDSSRFVGCLYNTAMELWKMQLDEAMSSGAPLAFPNKAIGNYLDLSQYTAHPIDIQPEMAVSTESSQNQQMYYLKTVKGIQRS